MSEQLKITKLLLAVHQYRENKAKMHAQNHQNAIEGQYRPLHFDTSVEELIRNVMMKSRHRAWTLYEDEQILALQKMHGNRWTRIAKEMNGRTANQIKARWNSLIKQKASEIEHSNIQNVRAQRCTINFDQEEVFRQRTEIMY